MRKLSEPCLDHGCKGFGLGYATAWVVRDGHRHTTTKHRKVFFEATGEWPEVVRHKCDNPRCIQLSHLEAGSAADNMQDMHTRGRAGDCRNFGSTNGRAVLSDEDVRTIRETYRPMCRINGIPALARRYGVGTSQIHRVLKGVQRNAKAR